MRKAFGQAPIVLARQGVIDVVESEVLEGRSGFRIKHRDQGVVGKVGQAHLANRGKERAHGLQRLAVDICHIVAFVGLRQPAKTQTLRRPCRVVVERHVDGARVRRIAAVDGFQDEAGVLDRAADRPHLVEGPAQRHTSGRATPGRRWV